MERFRDFTGLAVPYLRENVDTDQIIPKQFLTSVKKTGYGLFLFNDERWLEPARDAEVTREQLAPNLDFPLNQARYEGAQVLLAGSNFGCGSSREHAVWALTGYGLRAIIAPGFADIFSGNASKNGLLLVTLPEATVLELAKQCEDEPGFAIEVNLSAAEPYVAAKGVKHQFAIDAGVRERLLAGLDDIAATERLADQIQEYEERRRQQEPWLDIGQ